MVIKKTGKKENSSRQGKKVEEMPTESFQKSNSIVAQTNINEVVDFTPLDDNLQNDTLLSGTVSSEASPQASPKDIPPSQIQPTHSPSKVDVTPGTVNGNWKQKIIAFFKNPWNLGFLLVFWIGFFIRWRFIRQESLWNDSAVHMWVVVKAAREPLYLLSQDFYYQDHILNQFTALVFYLFHHNIFLVSKLTALFFGMVGIVLIYLLGSEIKDKSLGLIAATLLAFHNLFWFFNTRFLGDPTLATATIFILYCFVMMNKKKSTFWSVMTGFSFIIALFAKFQAAHFFMILIIYYLLFERRNLFSKPYFYAWVIPLSFAVLTQLISSSPTLFRALLLFVNLRGMPYGLDTTKLFPFVFTWYLLIFAVIGLLLALAYRLRQFYFPAFMFLFYWLFSEAGLDNPDARHLLFMVPILILFSSFAIQEVANYLSLLMRDAKMRAKIQWVVILLALIFISFHQYNTGDAFITAKSYGYTGYPEAGQWLTENVPEDVPIFAGSPRMIRAFTEREYHSLGEADPSVDVFTGGSVWYLRGTKYLENRTAFEEDLAMLSKTSDVYLEIDTWEYTQPSWYYPISQESVNYFLSLGFKPVKIVEREVPTSRGLSKLSVILIFKKEKENG